MRHYRPVLWLLLVGAAAPAQVSEDSDLTGYSGFVREVREYHYEGSIDLPLDNGAFIRSQGVTTERTEIAFTFADGVGTGTVTRNDVDTYRGQIHYVGKCLNGNQGTADQIEFGVTTVTESTSGPAICSAYADDTGYSAECFSEVPRVFTRTSTSTGIVSSNCPEIENSNNTYNDTVDTEDFGFGLGFIGTVQGPLPAVMSGSETIQDDSFTRTTKTWMLARQGEHELLLEPQGDYATWRPKAGLHERERGNTMVIKATLRKRGGGKPNMLAKQITFRLSQRSHEPGVMMNDPSPAKRSSPTLPDLGFEPELNESLGLTIDEGLGVATTEAEGSYEVVYVHLSSFDWGAYGVITAEAVLHSGERVAGIVERPGQFELLIPKRRSIDDPIAAGWRAAGPGREGDATADDENQPAGDGHAGDGLSLYEEYRGFSVNYARTEGDPTKKEVFVRNGIGPSGLTAAGLFAQATGLLVHPQLAASEMDDHRAINFNSSGRFQRNRQHALDLVAVPEKRTYAIAIGGPSTPGGIEALEVPVDLLTQAPAAYAAATIAHELAHGVNVKHHGETDLWDRKYVVINDAVYETHAEDTSSSTDGKTPVTLFFEDGNPFPNERVKPDRSVHVGVRQGQHSGHETCMMRYDSAKFHVRANASERFLNASPEIVGTALCESATGTGVNASSHLPAPRYGDASSGRGSCTQQICVNDRHTHAGGD